jgi:hypothetical protein
MDRSLLGLSTMHTVDGIGERVRESDTVYVNIRLLDDTFLLSFN